MYLFTMRLLCYNVPTSLSCVNLFTKTQLEFQKSREINELFMQYCCHSFASISRILTLSDRFKRQFFRIAPPAPAKTSAFDPNPTQIRTAHPRWPFRSKRQWLHRRH